MWVFMPVDAVIPTWTHTPNKVVSHFKMEDIFLNGGQVCHSCLDLDESLLSALSCFILNSRPGLDCNTFISSSTINSPYHSLYNFISHLLLLIFSFCRSVSFILSSHILSYAAAPSLVLEVPKLQPFLTVDNTRWFDITNWTLKCQSSHLIVSEDVRVNASCDASSPIKFPCLH